MVDLLPHKVIFYAFRKGKIRVPEYFVQVPGGELLDSFFVQVKVVHQDVNVAVSYIKTYIKSCLYMPKCMYIINSIN